jgi:acyl dehydratase
MTTVREAEAAADGGDEFGKLTAAGLEAFRGKIGVDWPYNRWTTWNEAATRDGIRHYANGFGDDNPLWCDPEYAAKSRWGGIVAPPGFLEGAGLTPKITTPPEVKARGKGALSGVHMFWAGDHIQYFRQVREDDRLWVRRFYVDIKEKERSRFGGRSAVSVRRRVYWNDAGELIAIWDADFVHTERAAAAERNTENKRHEQHQYTRDELEEVDRAFAGESVRGADKRYFEDVQVGEQFPARFRGPLVTGDVIAWLQGNGRHEIFPYRLNWKNRQRMGGFYSLNEFGAWDSAMRVHWDDAYARSVGARRAYDYGMLRNAWIMHAVTDWMGDDAIIVGVDDRVTGFNTLGDLTKITGSVSAIDDSGDHPEVTCALECHNQLGERTAHGTVRVRLPSRTKGLPEYPAPPADHGLLPGMPTPEEGPWAR